MKITADTNLLVRVTIEDDVAQAARARDELAKAELVAVTLTTLCELSWVLRQGYGLPRAEIARAIRVLTAGESVVTDVPAIEAGLAQLDAGGDFADGVIAYEGRWLGGEAFVSFDRRAIRLMRARGLEAREPG